MVVPWWCISSGLLNPGAFFWELCEDWNVAMGVEFVGRGGFEMSLMFLW